MPRRCQNSPRTRRNIRFVKKIMLHRLKNRIKSSAYLKILHDGPNTKNLLICQRGRKCLLKQPATANIADTKREFRVSSASEIAISDNTSFVQQSGQINCLMKLLKQLDQQQQYNYAYLNTMDSTVRSFSSFVLLIQTAKFHITKLLGWHSW